MCVDGSRKAKCRGQGKSETSCFEEVLVAFFRDGGMPSATEVLRLAIEGSVGEPSIVSSCKASGVGTTTSMLLGQSAIYRHKTSYTVKVLNLVDSIVWKSLLVIV